MRDWCNQYNNKQRMSTCLRCSD